MAENPFEGGAAEAVENEAEVAGEENEMAKEGPSFDERVTLDAVAKRLLNDNFILSALELHTELLESGRDLKRLRDFFSNPANFEPRFIEQRSTTLRKTFSQLSYITCRHFGRF